MLVIVSGKGQAKLGPWLLIKGDYQTPVPLRLLVGLMSRLAPVPKLLHETKGARLVKRCQQNNLARTCGRGPRDRSTNGGTIVASFSLATADRQKDGQGNWQGRTEWHNLVAFNRTAKVIRDYVRKGSQLLIEGKIQTRTGAIERIAGVQGLFEIAPPR
jgi:hypothetical protein